MFDIIIITGIIITFITMIIGSNNPNTLTGLEIGLGFILFGVLIYCNTRINEIYNVKNIFELILDIMPHLLIISSIIICIYIIGMYFTKISTDKVSDSFKLFKNWFIIFTIFQVASILYYYSKPGDKKKSDYLIYIFGIFNSIFLIIMYTTLTYFTTDGFRNITI
uniref:Uncharacterized protein n=1 Tax=viral metagenome TaxID=1070528 RepID=A0A6C0H985_9ZZZZ